MPSKLKSLRRISKIVSRLKRLGKKVVFTNGCFDILHVGHVRVLKEAKSLGDILVVGLNRDASVKGLKGPERPVTNENDRAEVLCALAVVDYAIFFKENTPEKLIHAVRPDFLVKGGDWKKKDIAGAAFVESYGGKVIALRFTKGYSSTKLIEKIFAAKRDESAAMCGGKKIR